VLETGDVVVPGSSLTAHTTSAQANSLNSLRLVRHSCVWATLDSACTTRNRKRNGGMSLAEGSTNHGAGTSSVDDLLIEFVTLHLLINKVIKITNNCIK